MATAVAPTPTQRPPERATQRTAHSSAIGHGVGIGGNAALYAFGTYGWGIAAAIMGIFAAMFGLKHFRRRRGRGGLLGGGSGRRGGGLLGRMFGGGGRRGAASGSRSGGLLGRRGGASGAGRGTSKGGVGGFLSRLAGNRSSTPKRGGGIPGRGSSSARSRNPLSRGRSKGGRGIPGGSKSGKGTRGSKRGLLGSRSGGRSRGTKGAGSGPGRSGGKSRARGLASRLNPFRRGKDGKGLRGLLKRLKRRKKGLNSVLTNPGPKHPPKKPNKNSAPPSGWQPAPTTKKPTKWKERDMGRPPTPSAGTGGAGGGKNNLTAAAEQLAAALSRPGHTVNTLTGMDDDFGDLAKALDVLQNGMKTHTSVITQGMPAERAAHEELGRMTKQLGQLAEAARMLQSDERRRTAADHERINNGRPNEQGYDHQSNQR